MKVQHHSYTIGNDGQFFIPSLMLGLREIEFDVDKSAASSPLAVLEAVEQYQHIEVWNGQADTYETFDDLSSAFAYLPLVEGVDAHIVLMVGIPDMRGMVRRVEVTFYWME